MAEVLQEALTDSAPLARSRHLDQAPIPELEAVLAQECSNVRMPTLFGTLAGSDACLIGLVPGACTDEQGHDGEDPLLPDQVKR